MKTWILNLASDLVILNRLLLRLFIIYEQSSEGCYKKKITNGYKATGKKCILVKVS